MPSPPKPNSRHSVFLALGANLGNPLKNLREAAKSLQSLAVAPPVFSSPWITAPRNCPPNSPPFANAALQLILPHEIQPQTLLAQCQAIERSLGRRPKKQPNEARPLDIDLIAFNSLVGKSPQLTLPHPRAHQRFFVLAPLNEIAPHLILPGHSQSVAEYLAACPADTCARQITNFQWPTT